VLRKKRWSCAWTKKRQIPALDRTQPSLTRHQGHHPTQTPDDKRHGPTTLFAALNPLDGTVLNSCLSRHRHQEWQRFIKQNDAHQILCLDRLSQRYFRQSSP
jgi:hypothetical protein